MKVLFRIKELESVLGAFDPNKKMRQSRRLCLRREVGLKVDYPAEFSLRLGCKITPLPRANTFRVSFIYKLHLNYNHNILCVKKKNTQYIEI
jgi:hypothetical protein